MGLSVVELQAVGALLEKFVAGAVAALADENRILLDAGSPIVDDANFGLQLMYLVVWLNATIGVVGERGQVGQLVETVVVTLALEAVEFHIGDVALRFGRGAPADIAEATRHFNVRIGEKTRRPLLGNHIKGNRVHEILAVRAFEEPQHHTVGLGSILFRTPSHSVDDMRRPQIQTDP